MIFPELDEPPSRRSRSTFRAVAIRILGPPLCPSPSDAKIPSPLHYLVPRKKRKEFQATSMAPRSASPPPTGASLKAWWKQFTTVQRVKKDLAEREHGTSQVSSVDV